MARQWASIAVLALVALVKDKGAALPTRMESPQGTLNTTSEHVATTCPHIIKRIATPQQFSGDWYPWEVLRHNASQTEAMSCVKAVFGWEDGRLNLRLEKQLNVRTVILFGDSSYTQNSNGLWTSEGDPTWGYQLGFASNETSLLVICSTSVVASSEHPWMDVGMSMVLGRQRTRDEAALGAAMNRTALAEAQRVDSVVIRRPNCTVPTDIPAHARRAVNHMTRRGLV